MLKALATIGLILAIIAVGVRLSSNKATATQSANTIKDGFNAVSNIFNGAFRG